jgi:translation initiation factor IF-2
MTGMNVDKLLEVIILQAEIHEYKANPNRLAIGAVVESSVEKGLGSTNTVIVQNGSLYKGDFVIAGSAFGKIKIMFDENNNEVKIAEPSTPVKLIGLNKSVASGQKFIVSKDERLMKEFASKVNDIENEENVIIPTEVDPSIKRFNLIIKTDVYGSLEAIKDLVNQISIEGIKPIIVKSGVGGINENDVMIGKSSKSIIIGFNVKPMKNISDSAAQAGIKILFYDIIYKLQDDITKMMEGTVDPIVKEEETGEAIIQQI